MRGKRTLTSPRANSVKTGNPEGRKIRGNISRRKVNAPSVPWAWPIRDNAARKLEKVSSQDRK